MATEPHHGWRLRKGRVSEPGRAYLVTAVTKDRSPVFRALGVARTAIRSLHDPHVARRARTLAFVVMPDHLHWLVQLADEPDLSATVRLYKAKVSARCDGSIWQKGFHDRAVRREEDLRDVARYVIANPLRAGLVERVGDYPHWDAVWLEDNPDGLQPWT